MRDSETVYNQCDKKWTTVKSIKSSLNAVLPRKANRKKQKWMTDHILNLMENRKQFKNSDKDECNRLNKQIKLACEEAKEKWLVTDYNPALGSTHLVEHEIHLKPDAVLKQQRPYRLTPDKREVLRHGIRLSSLFCRELCNIVKSVRNKQRRTNELSSIITSLYLDQTLTLCIIHNELEFLCLG